VGRLQPHRHRDDLGGLCRDAEGARSSAALKSLLKVSSLTIAVVAFHYRSAPSIALDMWLADIVGNSTSDLCERSQTCCHNAHRHSRLAGLGGAVLDAWYCGKRYGKQRTEPNASPIKRVTPNDNATLANVHNESRASLDWASIVSCLASKRPHPTGSAHESFSRSPRRHASLLS